MRLKEGCTITETLDGGVVLDMKRGVYWQLNEPGIVLLKMVIEHISEEDLMIEVRRRHPGHADIAAADAAELIEEFRNEGLIVHE